MTIGTKSVLYGAHCFFIHPWFVAWAWWRLWGFPWDPRLWVAFFVHDLGYIGKPNMDGPEGEMHPQLGGDIMNVLFGWQWSEFTEGHSRFYAQAANIPVSRLCAADKLAFVLTPDWLYLPLVYATGEIHEYMAHAAGGASGKYQRIGYPGRSLDGAREWAKSVRAYLQAWVTEEKARWMQHP